MSKLPSQIVVLGAGYAGLVATMRLAGKTKNNNVAITLVNASDSFVERLRLHEYAANRPLATRPLSNLLRDTGVTFVQGTITGIEPTAHQVQVQTDGRTRHLHFDYLVYALGSMTAMDQVPGVREYAYSLNLIGTHTVHDLRAQLPALAERQGRLLICGGGATGIETAAEFAEAYPNLQVRLVTRGEFGAFRGEGVGTYIRESLTRFGVTIQDHTNITQISSTFALTSTGEQIPFDLCLWVGGFAAPALARQAGLAVNERGQILVDSFLRSLSHPTIYGIGDAAIPHPLPGRHVRMSAFTALLLGAHGADSIAATVQHKSPKPFHFNYMGQGIALGHHDAIAYNSTADDQPRRPYFTGELAGRRLRRVFVGGLHSVPSLEKRFPGAFFWLGRNAPPKAAAHPQPIESVKLPV